MRTQEEGNRNKLKEEENVQANTRIFSRSEMISRAWELSTTERIEK